MRRRGHSLSKFGYSLSDLNQTLLEFFSPRIHSFHLLSDFLVDFSFENFLIFSRFGFDLVKFLLNLFGKFGQLVLKLYKFGVWDRIEVLFALAISSLRLLWSLLLSSFTVPHERRIIIWLARSARRRLSKLRTGATTFSHISHFLFRRLTKLNFFNFLCQFLQNSINSELNLLFYFSNFSRFCFIKLINLSLQIGIGFVVMGRRILLHILQCLHSVVDHPAEFIYCHSLIVSHFLEHSQRPSFQRNSPLCALICVQ